MKETPAADFVSVIADSEPTQEEWASILSENGYTEEQIEDILLATESWEFVISEDGYYINLKPY